MVLYKCGNINEIETFKISFLTFAVNCFLLLLGSHQIQVIFCFCLGYNAYLGMLYMEHTHNNPVLRVFCQLLMDNMKRKKALMKMDGGTLKNLIEEETGGAGLDMKAKEFILMEEGSVKGCSEQRQEFIELKEMKDVRRQSEEEIVKNETEPLEKSDSCLPKEFTETEDGVRAEQIEELVETKKTLSIAEIEKMEEDVVVGTGETDKFVQTQESAVHDKGQERFSKSLQETINTGDGDDGIGLPESSDEANQPPKAKKRSYCFY